MYKIGYSHKHIRVKYHIVDTLPQSRPPYVFTFFLNHWRVNHRDYDPLLSQVCIF